MPSVTSADGTRIAYEVAGDGPPVILVDGALCYRESGPCRPLAALLRREFAVYCYDRRGRGASGDTAPYAVEREVEDLAALVAAAGGEVCLYGSSSGAALALEAAARLGGIRRLALYEAPYIVGGGRPPIPDDNLARVAALLAAGRRGAAVRRFMRQVGVPAPVAALMRLLPAWPKLTGVAHTLPYDYTIMDGLQRGRPLPAGRWDGATMPTLVMDGGKSPAPMRAAMRQLAETLPAATYRTLPGQTHILKPGAVAPVLTASFRD